MTRPIQVGAFAARSAAVESVLPWAVEKAVQDADAESVADAALLTACSMICAARGSGASACRSRLVPNKAQPAAAAISRNFEG
jgi:hypothetical protein